MNFEASTVALFAEKVLPLSTADLDEEYYYNSLSYGKDKAPIVSNHTRYPPGGENFEHDDTGSRMNYSGVEDDVYDALKEHEDWQEGYDY